LNCTVDVIIAAHNRAATIERAVLSALDQPEVAEVIVIDDCSSDDTENISRRMAAEHGKRVVVRRLPVNRGPAAARNFGLEISTASWAAILDGDDFFLPGRVQKLLSHAHGCDFVADNIVQVQEGREDIHENSLLQIVGAPWQLNLEEFVLGNVERRGRFRKELGFLKPLMRRSFLDAFGLRYDESLRLGEDYALYARGLALGARFVVIPTSAYVSVERANSLSGHHTQQDLERLRDVDLDLVNIIGLTINERRAIKQHYRSVDAKVQWIAIINAKKERSFSQFYAPFFRSSTVSSFLIKNLFEQACLRSGRWFYKIRRDDS
jgi:succinoglycan biosynthesis protein ExoU